MSIISKIFTALRGGAREAGEAVVDANSTRIFEQEIVDAENNLKKARQDLTDVMAQKMKVERESNRLRDDITEHENYVAKALEKGDEALAMEVAEKIASLETELEEKQQILSQFGGQVERLKQLIKNGERQVADHRRQLSMVKTTESVQKATAAISDSFVNSSSKLNKAKDSLERIKARQARFDDRLQAAEELDSEMSGKGLEDRLKAAGIKGSNSSANAVLERLKNKQK
ncbi:PspA/IM30 family protein [Pelagibaculum spongiae]|uniref:Phage shock protein A n=1 Tax=Pelagibaculum spongiae TaxID=2080658 RepID=A0A2V1GS10_9GAMM|nr:PspA/IM30 family protein [Pelagibaculum spongiae]PVZ63866.1 phage shock protein A [Pelagibaculum spongiae]